MSKSLPQPTINFELLLKTLRCRSDLRIATFWLKWAKSLKLNSPAFNHNSLCDLLQLVLNYVASFRICVSPQVFRSNTQLTPICSARSPCLAAVYYIKRLLIKLIWYNTRNNIYVKIKAFFRIEFYISENFRFINLHRIINFCPITPVWLFNTVPKYRDVACLTRMGGTHRFCAETRLASHPN